MPSLLRRVLNHRSGTRTGAHHQAASPTASESNSRLNSAKNASDLTGRSGPAEHVRGTPIDRECAAILVRGRGRSSVNSSADGDQGGWSVSDFVLKEMVGEGSYGKVYRAFFLRSKSGDAEVAVKVMQNFASDMADLEREVKYLEALNHPNIVNYFGCISTVSTTNKDIHELWIVMDYCGAGSLLDAMTVSGKCLSEDHIAHAMRSTLLPLQYIHSRGVMHRDIKAANLLLNEFGVVKLADFGVSAEITALTKRSTVIGSPYWMAPEVIMEDQEYDQAADVWSLGITAIELAEGQPPLYNVHPMRALVQIQRNTPPTLQSGCANDDRGKRGSTIRWSEDFHDFIACCLQRAPEDRWTTLELLNHPFVLAADDADAKMFANLISEVSRLQAEERLQKTRGRYATVKATRKKSERQLIPGAANDPGTVVIASNDDFGDHPSTDTHVNSRRDSTKSDDSNTGFDTTVIHEGKTEEYADAGSVDFGTTKIHGTATGGGLFSEVGSADTSSVRSSLQPGGDSSPQSLPWLKGPMRTMNLGGQGNQPEARPVSAPPGINRGMTRLPRSRPGAGRSREFQFGRSPSFRALKRDARVVRAHWRQLSVRQYAILGALLLVAVLVSLGLFSLLSWAFSLAEERTTTIDLYFELQVPRQVVSTNLDDAYRRLHDALSRSLDRGNCPTCEAEMKRASFAYEVLSDPERRASYDETHELAGLPRAGHAGALDKVSGSIVKEWALTAAEFAKHNVLSWFGGNSRP